MATQSSMYQGFEIQVTRTKDGHIWEVVVVKSIAKGYEGENSYEDAVKIAKALIDNLKIKPESI